MKDFNWKGMIGTIAPTLAAAFGGPAAGMAATMITSAFGLTGDEDETELAAKIQFDPEAIAKLKVAEFEFKAKLKELDIKETEVIMKDIDSARNREIMVGDRVPALLATVITAGFFGVLFYILAVGLPVQGGEALLIMLGTLGTAWISVVAYYFGSTKSSAEKTKLLAGRSV